MAVARRGMAGLGRFAPGGASEPWARTNTDGNLIYAIGDIHGRYDLMKMLLEAIVADVARVASDHRPILIFLGDYVDRGPDSAKVLQAMLWLQARTDFEVHALKGNHEHAMLRFIDAPHDGAAWIGFGGASTLAAYGVEPPALEAAPSDLTTARDALLRNMPAAHLRFLERLELMAVVGDYAFVHAGARPGVPLLDQTEDDLLWIRAGFLEGAAAFERVIVHGHTWINSSPQMHEHRIGADTGAYFTGVLTAVRLADGDRAVLQATAEPAAAREGGIVSLSPDIHRCNEGQVSRT